MKLTMFKNIRNTILIRIVVYFILIIFITLATSSYFTYSLFSDSFKGEIINFNDRVLNQLCIFSDDFIFKNINNMALNVAVNDSDYSILMKTSNDPFRNYPELIYNINKRLGDLVASNNEFVDSVCIHFRNNNLLVTSNFSKAIDEKTASGSDEFNWIDRFYDSNQTILWFETRSTRIYSDMSNSKGDIITVVCSYPLASTGTDTEGCIAVNIKEDALNSYLVAYNSTNLGQLMILDNDGKIISHNDKSCLYKDISVELFVNKILNSTGPDSFETVYEKEKHFVSFVRSRNNNWYYVSMIPTEMFYQKDYLIKKKIFIVSAIILFCVFVMSNVFSYSIYGPLRKILNKYIPAFKNSSSNSQINEYNLIESLFSNASSRISDLQETMDKNALMIRHNFFIDLLNNRIPNSDMLADLLKFSNISFSKRYYLVVIFKIDKKIINSNQQNEVQFFKYSVIDFISKLNNENFSLYPVDFNSSTISVIINSDDNSDGFVDQFIEDVEAFCSGNFGFSLVTGTGRFVDDLIVTNKSYMDAVMCLQYRFLYPERNVFNHEDVIKKTATNIEFSEINDYIEKNLKLENYTDIEADLYRFQTTIKNYNVSYSTSKIEISKLIAILKQYMSDKNIIFEEAINETTRNSMLSPDNLSEFVKTYLFAVRTVFDYLSDKRLNRNLKLAEAAKEFILNNLHMDLSLNFTAEAMHVSPYHFSRIFKEETGINYIDYVTSCKIEKARDLLVTTNLTVEEITSRIGYSHSTYFSKKFKEFTGKTPSEYRNDLLNRSTAGKIE